MASTVRLPQMDTSAAVTQSVDAPSPLWEHVPVQACDLEAQADDDDDDPFLYEALLRRIDSHYHHRFSRSYLASTESLVSALCQFPDTAESEIFSVGSASTNAVNRPIVEEEQQRTARSSSIGSDDTLVSRQLCPQTAQGSAEVPLSNLCASQAGQVASTNVSPSNDTSATVPIVMSSAFCSQRQEQSCLSEHNRVDSGHCTNASGAKADKIETLARWLPAQTTDASVLATVTDGEHSGEFLDRLMDDFERRLYCFHSMSQLLTDVLQIQTDANGSQVDEMLLSSILRAASQSLEAMAFVSWFRQSQLANEAVQEDNTSVQGLNTSSSAEQTQKEQSLDESGFETLLQGRQVSNTVSNRTNNNVRPNTAQIAESGLGGNVEAAVSTPLHLECNRSISNTNVRRDTAAQFPSRADLISSPQESSLDIDEAGTRFLFPRQSPSPPATSASTFLSNEAVATRKPKPSLKSLRSFKISLRSKDTARSPVSAPSTLDAQDRTFASHFCSPSYRRTPSDATGDVHDEEMSIVLASLEYRPPSLASPGATETNPARSHMIDTHLARITNWIDGLHRKRRHRRRCHEPAGIRDASQEMGGSNVLA